MPGTFSRSQAVDASYCFEQNESRHKKASLIRELVITEAHNLTYQGPPTDVFRKAEHETL